MAAMETDQYEWKVLTKKTPKASLLPIQILTGIIATTLSVVMVALGIAWLASIVTVVVSGTLLGYAVFFGIPPIVLALLLTSALYIVYWPIALLARAFWSATKGKNRFNTANVMTGAILCALAIATTFVIAVNLGRTISFDYQDEKTRVIIDDGTICISTTNSCSH